MTENNYQTATFGAGCFWGVETAFAKIVGVIETDVGYMGGTQDNPTYQDICYNNSGHAEVCQVIYDPMKVNYNQLLKTFFEIHDPQQLNRQGPDIGEQYRSVVFYHDDTQKETAQNVFDKIIAAEVFPRKIVTQLSEASKFFIAEDYHQEYFAKKGLNSHCAIGTNVNLEFLLESK